MGFALEWGRGAGKRIQIGAPTLQAALDAYLARPKLRTETHKTGMRQQFDLHLKDLLRLPLDQISKSMAAKRHRSITGTPSSADHVLKYFRSVWNYARRLHELPEIPKKAIEWYDEKPKSEIIEDLRAWTILWMVCKIPSTRPFDLLLFISLRKTEAFTLEWKKIRKDHIHLPMTQNGRSFDLPILRFHHEI
ncbi:hypothetical protein ACOTTU_19985 [Roseobacter sp. EG26]|uniref:hypothetical protein n=1 Tax=Roseobacter sp. EG26 TaxID=3412477 RepID=UPI003CE5983E